MVAGLLLAMTLALGAYAWRADSSRWEVGMVRALQGSPLPGLHQVSTWLAIAGHGAPWIGIVTVLAGGLLVVGGPRLVLMLAMTATMQDVGAMIKLLVERARPSGGSVEVWRQVSSYSFPSGHTLGATLVFGFLFFAVARCNLPVAGKWMVRVVCVTWIGLMGVSRVEVGAHWPTDVLAAYLVGALLLLPVVYVLRHTPHGAPGRSLAG